jgi:tRNA dimethylallyltransferase
MSSKLFLILGQTATGKTAKATKLAKEMGGELINCDSRQLYTGLDIITGKTDNPTTIPMHMVDIVNPHDPFSAFDFARQGIVAIQEITARSRVPIVVGGTGNYARMLLYLDPSNPNLSHGELVEWVTRKQNEGATKQDLQQKLMRLDMGVYNSLTPSDRENPRRLIRAIQRVENKTGELLDSDSPHALASQYEVTISILLHESEEQLISRLMQRVESRIALGALGECESLLKAGYSRTDPGLATIGYQSVFRYLAGEIGYDAMKMEWATKERQYAKRQKTYLLKYFPQAAVVTV